MPAEWKSAVRSGFRTQAISPQVEVMSLVGLVLLPIRFGRGLADKVLRAVTPESPAPPSALVVVDGMPEGVPPRGAAGGHRRSRHTV